MPETTQTFDVYHKWLGIPPAEQPPNHYRLLGIAKFEGDADVIETAAEQRMTLVRSRQTGKYAAESQKLLNEIAAARVELLQPDRKQAYDATLRSPPPESLRSPPPESLRLAASQKKAARPLPRAAALTSPTSISPPAVVVQPPAPAQPSRTKSQLPLIASIGGVVVLLVVGGLIAAPFLLRGPQRTTASSSGSPEPAPPVPKPAEPAAPAPTPAVAPAPASATPPTDPPPAEPEFSPPGDTESPAETAASPATSAEATAATQPKEPPADSPVPPPAEETSPTDSPALQPLEARSPVRPAVPDVAELEKARAAVREIYAAQFAAAKTPEQKSRLAGEILGQAQVTFDDPAGKYVLLDTARRVGEQAGDLRLTLRACDQLAESFDVSVIPLKESALDACRKTARQAAELQQLASESLAVADEAVKAGDYPAAQRLAAAAGEAARKSRDRDLALRAAARAKEINQLAAAFAKAGEAFDRLKADPQDAASHLVVGKFLCFDKGEWTVGLAHLAQGSDEELARLAKEDEAEKANSEAWLALGDGWLARAKKAEGSERVGAERRAAYWYRKALPTLAGLNRVKIEKALETLPKALPSEEDASTIALEPPGQVATTGEGPAGTDGPLLTLFEDEPEVIQQMVEGDGTIVLERMDVFRGNAAALVTPRQKFASYLAGVRAKIREKPETGEYRFLRLAWKKVGGTQIGLQLHRSENAGAKLPGEIWVRYHVGPEETFIDGSASKRIGDKLPTEWTVVTLDLFADYGEFTLSGFSPTPLDGDYGLFDHVYLARELKDFDELEKAKTPRTATAPKRPHDRAPTKPPPELGIVGAWTVTYEGGAVRHYEFDGRGNVRFVDEQRMGRVFLKGSDVLIDFSDGKWERLRLVDGVLGVEHFNPVGRYPDSPTLTGRAERTR
jgi:hypothetical protein